MDNYFEITLGHGEQLKTYEVRDYVHKADEEETRECKFEVFYMGQMILSLTPEGQYLKTCKNPAELDEETIHIIIEKIEAYHI